ncbi:hypothetical protein FG379_000039 [Cryptosporidium bovis]|uniref:uncharacterized protein n=1 Tax=Cryptosporidium bovis TaxID=310047 RepID=UPI00351A136B|nr:hypothetical protein FG379_000039 [Cryptosporidium bovis]
MYIIIVYLFLFEFLFSKIGNRIVSLVKIDHLLRKVSGKKNVCQNSTNMEIMRLEKEVWELNKPSTFTEYVKKNRQLSKLKKKLQEQDDEDKNNSKSHANIIGKITDVSLHFFNLIHILVNSVKLIPIHIKQILFFIVLTIFIDESKYSVYVDPRLYSPFCQGCPGRFKTLFLNKVMSYGIALTIYDFGKYLIKLTYLNIKLNIENNYTSGDINNNKNK